jgi:Tfp pilus assembly protein PilO
MNRNITATILVVLAIGIYLTVTKGMLADANAVQQVNVQYSTAIDSADQLIQVRDQVLKNYNGLSQDDRDRLDKMIPNTVDNIRLIIDLNSVALRHGFSLRNIKAVAGANAQNGNGTSGSTAPVMPSNNAANANVIATPVLDTVTVSFSVSAPYLQFISFMQDLEADLRIMDLTHLTMSANDTGTYDYNVEFKTYWMRTQ